MTRYIKDDRRYMTHEVRAIDDARYRGEIVRGGVKAVETCFCGKTVVATHGVPVRIDGAVVTCPRECGPR